MRVLGLQLSSWQEARTLADQLKGWSFRGHEDASWPLSTSLQRASNYRHNTSPLLSKLEEQIIEEFQRRAQHFLRDAPRLDAVVEWMAIIQHFGGPTRLLDFTKSFYVAAFFAVEKSATDSAIWCVNDIAFYHAAKAFLKLSDTAIPYWQIAYSMAATAQTLLQKKEHNFTPFVFQVQPFSLHERLAAQQGLFLCPLTVDMPFHQCLAQTLGGAPSEFTNPSVVQYDPKSHTGKTLICDFVAVKIVLPLGIHYDALEDLWSMNVNAATLFPGLDGFARSLHHFVRLDKLWQIKYEGSVLVKGQT